MLNMKQFITSVYDLWNAFKCIYICVFYGIIFQSQFHRFMFRACWANSWCSTLTRNCSTRHVSRPNLINLNIISCSNQKIYLVARFTFVSFLHESRMTQICHNKRKLSTFFSTPIFERKTTLHWVTYGFAFITRWICRNEKHWMWETFEVDTQNFQLYL